MKKDLFVCSAYRPDKDFSCIDELERTLSIIDIDNNTVVMGGDLNLPDIDWKSHNVKPGAKHLDENNKLLSCIDKFGLAQLINEPTRITDTTRNCLDLLFVSNSSLVENVRVIPGFSDHCIPYVDMLPSVRINPKEKRKIYLFNKANWPEIKKGLQCFSLNTNLKKMTVNEIWETFRSTLDTLVNKFIPAKTVSGRHHIPWINSSIKKLMKKRDRLYSKMKKTNNYNLLPKLKKLKTHIQRNIRSAYWDYMNNIACDKTENKHGTTKKILGFHQEFKKMIPQECLLFVKMAF
jgi:hypothetical protein